eukprot:m.115007 g.115007  ORF g.115007 m.115007 type:complete len:107 (+) comp28390_c2_seq1:3215-3535(+)
MGNGIVGDACSSRPMDNFLVDKGAPCPISFWGGVATGGRCFGLLSLQHAHPMMADYCIAKALRELKQCFCVVFVCWEDRQIIKMVDSHGSPTYTATSKDVRLLFKF